MYAEIASPLNQERRLKLLRGFIEALRREKIIDFDISRFEHRLKLQKYVFLARKYGFNLGYDFSLYIHGPYSPELADDYYELARRDIPPETVELDRNFILLVTRKNEWWLEIASTLVLIKERYPDISDEEAGSLVKSAKPFAPNKMINEIMKELRVRGAIN